MRLLPVAALSLSLCLGASKARAAERAEVLFERGVEAFLAGKFEQGCPLLEQSYVIDPLPGVLFTLAECQFGWGKAKTAADNYGKFLDAIGRLPPAEASKHAERAAVAIRKRAVAARSIASVRITVSGTWVAGTRLTLDHKDVTLVVGKLVELDPGPHQVVLAQPGHARVVRSVQLGPAQSEAVAFTLSAEAPPAATNAQPAQEAPRAGAPTAAYVLGGVGALGVVVGTVTGLMAQSKKSTINDNCPGRVCNAEGRDAVDSGQRFATISTISFGVGIGALVGATYLFLRPERPAKSESRAFPRLSLELGSRRSVSLSAEF